MYLCMVNLEVVSIFMLLVSSIPVSVAVASQVWSLILPAVEDTSVMSI